MPSSCFPARIATSLGLVAIAAAAPAWADPLKGSVLDGVTLAPVRGATVSAPGGTPVKTDRVGGFTIDVAPGTTSVTVAAAGYDPSTEDVTVPGGGLADQIILLYPP